MDKEIYVVNLDFSKMRFTENNEALNTTVFSNYSLISLDNEQLKEVLPEITALYQKIIKKYVKKYRFTNEK